MAGKKFLNPILKIVLCLVGMMLMGYSLYGSIQAGEPSDRVTIVRALVFLGFTYLLVQSIKDLMTPGER